MVLVFRRHPGHNTGVELRHLQTFAAATELLSFTRAAQSLSLTQAAVSQHIAALEKELRISLFARTGRSVSPTDAGRRLYGYARRILDLLAEAERDVGHATAAVRGTLQIAASTVPAECLLPELLRDFHETHPGVRPQVIVSDSTEATRAVETGAAELGLIGEPPHTSKLTAVPIAEDELVLVLPPGHPLAGGGRVTARQLREVPIILREPGSGSRRCIERALEAAGVSPGDLNVVMEMNANDAIRQAVERGVGAAFLSRNTVARDVEDGRVATAPVEKFHARRQLYLITDPARIPTPPARTFLEFFTLRSRARGGRSHGTPARP
jgi:DNA-binding transcriptional LysR family regulator